MHTIILIVSRWIRSLHNALNQSCLPVQFTCFSSLFPLFLLFLSLSISLTSYSLLSLGTRSVSVLYSFMAGLALSLPLIRSGIMVWIRWWRGMPVLLTMVAISSHHFKVMCLMPFPPPLLALHYNTAAGRVTNTVNLLFAGSPLQRGKAGFFSSTVNTQNSALSITS